MKPARNRGFEGAIQAHVPVLSVSETVTVAESETEAGAGAVTESVTVTEIIVVFEVFSGIIFSGFGQAFGLFTICR